LHAKDPKNYPDANHKPEMAIALTPFELLCGFRTSHEILSNIKAHKELLELIGEESLTELAVKHHPEKQKAALKKIFTQIWNSSEEEIKHVITEITGRLLISKQLLYNRIFPLHFNSIDEGYRTTIDELILRLNEQYPEDIGVLAPFFLNYSTLKPGEAVYFGPNEPHSYLSGGQLLLSLQQIRV
jgi:mannose-6-phosphate isomerase